MTLERAWKLVLQKTAKFSIGSTKVIHAGLHLRNHQRRRLAGRAVRDPPKDVGQTADETSRDGSPGPTRHHRLLHRRNVVRLGDEEELQRQQKAGQNGLHQIRQSRRRLLRKTSRERAGCDSQGQSDFAERFVIVEGVGRLHRGIVLRII